MTETPSRSPSPLVLSHPSKSLPAARSLRRGLRFHGDESKQLDPLHGCPDAMVPAVHPVRTVIEYIGSLDLSMFRNKHSSLGRTPIDPRFKLQVWVYAGLVGKHYASEVARALETDAAFRLAAGGHRMSETMLKTFRSGFGREFEELVRQLVAKGIEKGLVDPQGLAVDSMRLRADASTASMRTVERSTARLAALSKVDAETLSDEDRALHAAKVEKHERALKRSKDEGRTGHSVTDPQAALMKFPSGASLPGHRVTVTSSGATERFVVSVLIDGDPTDFGKLEPAVLTAREALIGAGMAVVHGAPPMQVAADAGYMSEADLQFVVDQREQGRIDVIVPEAKVPVRRDKATGEAYFGRDEFLVEENGDVICPAGKLMHGPYKGTGDTQNWRGRGCESCALRPQCTSGKQRTLSISATTERLHKAVSDRLAMPGGQERYNKRIATVEPVFSYIEDAMHFTRASSRRTKTVHAEVMLKVIGYNILRLNAAAGRARSLRVFRFVFSVDALGTWLSAVWLPVEDIPSATADTSRESP